MKHIVILLTTLLFNVVADLSAAASKPNIVFIFADDWGWGDLGCHGHPYVKTPNIDRLAREGTDFQRFTVASGVCSPSRTAVMTGHFPARYNIDGHFAWVKNNAQRNMPDWLDAKTPTLPKMLQSAGYATAHFGKWHLSNDMIPDSPLPKVYGYDEYGAFNCAGEQMPVHEDARHAIAFMEKSVTAKKPFFINLWLHEPHTPFHTVPKYEWRFSDMKSREDQIYASVISHADDRIGEVLAALDRLKLTDNTLVIFSSDNGPARAAKPTPLELQYDTATGAGWGLRRPKASRQAGKATKHRSSKAASTCLSSPAGRAGSPPERSTRSRLFPPWTCCRPSANSPARRFRPITNRTASARWRPCWDAPPPSAPSRCSGASMPPGHRDRKRPITGPDTWWWTRIGSCW